MKFAVTEVIFKQAAPSLGGSAWFAAAAQGSFTACEYDTDTQLLTLSSNKPGVKNRRVHVSNTIDMVFGVTIAAKRAGGSTAADS